MNFMNGLCCYNKSEKVGKQKMQKEKGEKKLVIVFVRVNKVVENKREKNDNHTGNRGGKCLPKFDEPRPAENIFVEPGYVINSNPEYRDKNKSKVKTAVKFNRNINAKTLRFNDCLAVNKKYNPADGGR